MVISTGLMLHDVARKIEVPHHKLSPQHERWITKTESIALVIVMFLSFGLAGGLVGLAGYELQKHVS